MTSLYDPHQITEIRYILQDKVAADWVDVFLKTQNSDELIADYPSPPVEKKIIDIINTNDEAALKDLISSRKSSKTASLKVKPHIAIHCCMLANNGEAFSRLIKNNLGDPYNDEYGYLLPTALLLHKNDFVRSFIKNIPSKYVLNQSGGYLGNDLYFYATVVGNLEGDQILASHGYIPHDAVNGGPVESLFIGCAVGDKIEILKQLFAEGLDGINDNKPFHYLDGYGVLPLTLARSAATECFNYLCDKTDFLDSPFAAAYVLKAISTISSITTAFNTKDVIEEHIPDNRFKIPILEANICKIIQHNGKATDEIIGQIFDLGLDSSDKHKSRVGIAFLKKLTAIIGQHVKEGERSDLANQIVSHCNLAFIA